MHGLSAPAQTGSPSSIFESMSALADALRCRLLLILERNELTVSELCAVVQLPQSTVSRHLKVLADDGWIRARPEGTRRLYSGAISTAGTEAGGLWRLVRPEVEASAAADEDRRRLESVLAARRSKSQEFFDSAAGEWDGMRHELFGRRFDLHALLAFLDRDWTIGDLGSGTGHVAEALAPFTGRIIAVDNSEPMLEAARTRLDPLDNVEVRAGRLEALPISDGELDAAILGLVLHHMPEPDRVLAEAARCLKPGGRLLVLEMHSHDREEYRQRMGHVWLGFSEQQINRWGSDSGLTDIRFHDLPADPSAKGPTLFAASAVRAKTRTPTLNTTASNRLTESHHDCID